MYRRLRGPQRLSRLVQKLSPQPGFDSLTDNPVASRYTDCVIPAHLLQYYDLSNSTKFQHFVEVGRGLFLSFTLTYPKEWSSTLLPKVNVDQSTWRHPPYDRNIQQRRYEVIFCD